MPSANSRTHDHSSSKAGGWIRCVASPAIETPAAQDAGITVMCRKNVLQLTNPLPLCSEKNTHVQYSPSDSPPSPPPRLLETSPVAVAAAAVAAVAAAVVAVAAVAAVAGAAGAVVVVAAAAHASGRPGRGLSPSRPWNQPQARSRSRVFFARSLLSSRRHHRQDKGRGGGRRGDRKPVCHAAATTTSYRSDDDYYCCCCTYHIPCTGITPSKKKKNVNRTEQHC